MRAKERKITIEDGTSKAQLISALNEYENNNSVDVLTVYSTHNHLIILEFDGNSVNEWYIQDTQRFLENKKYESDLFTLLDSL